MATFRVIDNEADRCIVIIVGFVGDPIEVDAAEGDAECVILWEWGGSNGKLWGWSGCVGRGVFWWGDKRLWKDNASSFTSDSALVG